MSCNSRSMEGSQGSAFDITSNSGSHSMIRSDGTVTDKPKAPFRGLLDRIKNNDPTLRVVSMSRLPVLQVTADQVQQLWQAMQQNTKVHTMEVWFPSLSPPPTSIHAASRQPSSSNTCLENEESSNSSWSESSISLSSSSSSSVYTLPTLQQGILPYGMVPYHQRCALDEDETENSWSAAASSLPRIAMSGARALTYIRYYDQQQQLPLPSAQQLEKIELKHTPGNGEDYEFVTIALAANRTIRHLSVSSAACGAAYTAIFKGLTQQQLEQLPVVEDREKTSRRGADLTKIESKSMSGVQRLELGDARAVMLDEEDDADEDLSGGLTAWPLTAWTSLSVYLRTTQILHTLHLRGLKWTREHILALAKGLRGNTTLHTLELHQIRVISAATSSRAIDAQQQQLRGRTSRLVRGYGDLHNGTTYHAINEACRILFWSLRSSRVQVLNLIDCEPLANAVDAYFYNVFSLGCHAKMHTVIHCDDTLSDMNGRELQPSTSLHTLRLIECQLSNSTLHALAATAVEPKVANSLRVLDLRGNDLDDSMGPTIHSLVRAMPRLEKVILEENRLGDAFICYLAESFSKLSELNLRSNRLSGAGVKHLVDAMPSAPSMQGLKVLDLSENQIADEGAVTIARWLEVASCSLLHLEIESCSVSDQGLSALFRAMGVNKSMQRLLVSQNDASSRIDPANPSETAESISFALRHNTTLRELSLSSCRMSDVSVASVCAGLRENTTLQLLSVAFNALSNKGIYSLSQAIPYACLERLEIQFNDFDATGMSYLVEGVSRSVTLTDLFVLNTAAYDPSHESLLDQLGYWLGLNRSGRRFILQSDKCCKSTVEQQALPESVWPNLLERAERIAGVDAIHYFLKIAPNLIRI